MSDHVYKHVELTGSSTIGSDHAVAVAISKAAQSLRNMHWFRVNETRGVIDKDKITHWQVTVTVGFTLED